jgi:hypothetical protein
MGLFLNLKEFFKRNQEAEMGKKEDIENLKKGIKNLVDTKFQGNYKNCFDHYDKLGLHNEKIDKASLEGMLKNANIGKPWTRGTWASTIIKEVDVNADSEISWDELKKVIGAPQQ